MKVLILFLVCIFAHTPKQQHKHDNDHHMHHHSHEDHLHEGSEEGFSLDPNFHDDSHHHHHHEHFSSLTSVNSPLKPYIQSLSSLISSKGPLVSALASSILTTGASVLIFIFIWFIQKFQVLTDDLLSSLTSFASGALLGDVFLHLMHEIPHSTFSNLLIMAGVLIFFILDRALSHKHSSKKIEAGQGKQGPADKRGKGKNQPRGPGQDIKSQEKPAESELKTHHSHEESALLLLVADFLHNATDGMAIGASYAINPTLGISTTIAIFLHEIAHEVGDFIAFLKFGVSLTRALAMNLLTGLGSLIGTIISLYYGSTDTLTRIVLPIIAGNFLYVSMISMLAPMKKQKKSLIIWEVFFFCSGVGLMVLIEEL